MKNLLKLTALSLVTATAIYAGGYKIPETSTNGVALSAANIAHVHSADAAYYNPANMIFMDDENSLEADLMYIGLDPINFKGSGSQAGDNIDAKSESFLVPSINYVSAELGNVRLGLSIVVPAGSSKRWNDSPAVDKVEEFTLKVVEVNPTVAFKVSNEVAMAVGFRAVYSSGTVKSTSSASRDMTGDSVDFGYNLALAYKPTKALEFGVTYRSNIKLHEEGNAKLYIGSAKVYDGGASVTVPLPAALNIAAAYTFESATTVELVYAKTYWSSYSSLDFDYTSAISPILVPFFDDAIAEDWKNSEAYRLGLTQELDGMTLMAGVVLDNSPIPESRMSYELPGSNSVSVSLGGRYNINDKINVGISTLYSMRENRDIKNDDIEGTFSNANVLIVSAGLGYKF